MQFQKISYEETQDRFRKKGGRAPKDLTEYIDNLNSLSDGEGAEIAYEDGDKRRSHVLSYNRAAKQLGIEVKWDYTRGSNVAYIKRVGPLPATSSEPTAEKESPRRRRSRRSESGVEAEAVAA